MDTPLLIAGLGNPGSQYAKKRHNAGFIVVDELHAHHKFGPWKARFDGLLSEGSLGGRKTYLLKPQTFMNLSGDCVAPTLRFYKLPLEALVAVHDEIDLAPGRFRMKTGGGAAGAGVGLGAGIAMSQNMLQSLKPLATAVAGENKFCTQCGAHLPQTARFCSKCGTGQA